MNAAEFINQIDYPVIRIAGVGHPSGLDLAWIPPETEIPFDLDEIEGDVQDGEFTAANLAVGTNADGWKFTDWSANVIYAIWIRSDEAVWKAQDVELNEGVL